MKRSIYEMITEKMNDKMAGLQSLSTCPTCNGNCIKNATVKGSICEKCYSQTMNKRFANLRNKLTANYNDLTTHLYLADEMPVISSLYFRFEAFGDLETVDRGGDIQFINYVNICNANPRVNFAIWTKNPETIHHVLKSGLVKKPANLNIGISSLMVNVQRDVTKYAYFTDFIFTVYTLKYLLDNSLDYSFINCGARSCLQCHKCYEPHVKKSDDDIMIINELLKQDVKKAVAMGFMPAV